MFTVDQLGQGPVMLQSLNMAEQVDWQELGFNGANYIHRLYQIMNLAYADRDFITATRTFLLKSPCRGCC